ncbi:hypothetical protein [Phycicoccus sp. CSK15P-2]|nr:hypothetical protein [Phycicoccus sp. CSK15P-2]
MTEGASLRVEIFDADLQRRPWGLDDFRLSDPDGYYYRFISHR